VTAAALLVELFGRIPATAHAVVDDLTVDELLRPPADGANPIAWLVWHLARVEDEHLAEAFGETQLWIAGDWAASFGLPPDPHNTGYGHSPADVAAVRPISTEAALAYLDAVAARTRRLLEGMGEGDLDRIVDASYDPPVTLAVRLVSVAVDAFEHLGQAGYVRGLLRG
jgi:hypothetical protein